MFYLDVVSRVLHVWTAITLVGGSVFTLLVLMPAVKSTLSDETHQQLCDSVTGRWKRWVHLGIALFLLTGFYNYFRAMPLHRSDGLYHALVGSKMLLALAIFFLASALVGRSEKLAWVRAKRRCWLATLVLLAVVVVAISGFLKVRQTARPAAPATVAVSTVSPASAVSGLFFDGRA